MKKKKLYSREEFRDHLKFSAEKMHNNKPLQKKAMEVLVEADKNNWIHQVEWFGEPILNLTNDMFAIQEIIFKTKPDYVVETGIAWGGSLLFYASLLKLLGGKKVIGVDIFIPPDLVKRIRKHKVSENIELIKGGSTDENTINKIKNLTKGSKKVLVILDSDHTHQHVLRELEAYSNFVGKNQYLICCDTIVEIMPEQKHRPRAWGKGNNPMTALNEFLSKNKNFSIDYSFDRKLLFSCNPKGYLLCNK